MADTTTPETSTAPQTDKAPETTKAPSPPVHDDPLAKDAKRACIIFDQLLNMRNNARHISDLEGIRLFVALFNTKMVEVKKLLEPEPGLLQSLEFLAPISGDTSQSEYASAIIDGKRGQFMVHSGVLLATLRSFIMLHVDPRDEEKLQVKKMFQKLELEID